MGCFCCFKSSPSVDPLEEEFDLASQDSRQEERRHTRMMEEDAQIANGFLYEDAALEEEQIDKAIKESLEVKEKAKQFEDEQVKNDEQIAAVYQESVNNMLDSPPRLTEIKNISARAPLDEDEQLDKVIWESLKGKDLIEQFEDEQIAAIYQESFNNMLDSPPRLTEIKNISARAPLDEDEQLDKVIWESLKGKDLIEQFEDEQIAAIYQESLNNMLDSPPRLTEIKNISARALLDEDEQLVKVIRKESSREEEEERRRTKMIEDEERRRTRALEEERKRTKVIEEERRRTNMMEEDAQIANAFLYEDRERQINHNSALEDEQIAKAIAKSLKEKGKRKLFEEQMKKDEEVAQDLQNHFSKMSYEDSAGLDDEDEQFVKAVAKSLKEKGKGKQLEKDEQVAVVGHESLKIVEPPPRAPFDEDEQRIILESLKGKSQITEFADEVEENGNLPKENPPRSMCGGCNSEIEHGRSVNVLGVLWHPDCLWCDACHKAIAIHEVENHVSNSRGKFHRSCYQRYCYVCKEKVKIRMFNQHHFWKESYCPAHDTDGTPKCCSCERLEPRGTNYVMLDGRWLCLECMESAIMDSHECQDLHFEIREFFEGLNMKIEKQFPFLLVEKQALNKAEKEEKIQDNQNEVVTRGICLSEAQTVTSVSKGPKMGLNKQLMGMTTESQRVVRECEVTAILIIYGLPRLLTGYILAHEMMHAYLRLNGHRNLNIVLEEGLCQVLGHMWLESQTYAAINTAASSSLTPPVAGNATKKGECSDFEKKLVEFCKNQIEEDDSPVYGLGFKKVYEMVSSSSLPETLKKIIRQS